MSTLLNEILRGVFISGAINGGTCAGHKQGCKCPSCGGKKLEASTGRKNWKDRRRSRVLRAAKPVARAAGSSELFGEYEFEAPPAKSKKLPHVILVAGHDWENPKTKYVNVCFNRAKRLFKLNKNIQFTIFDFDSGKVLESKLAGSSLSWTLKKKHTTITKAHYKRSGGKYKFVGPKGVLSITDVYKYVTGIGAAAPGTVMELSFFSHAWKGGPALVNSYDSSGAARNPNDKDARTAKDFKHPNMSGAALVNFKKAFAKNAFTWIWGCSFTNAYRQVFYQLLGSKTYGAKSPGKINDSDEFVFHFNSLQLEDFSKQNKTFFPKVVKGKVPLPFKRNFKQVKAFFEAGLNSMYAAALAKATGVPCRAAFLGTYATFENGKAPSLPLMLVPRSKPPYDDNFTGQVNFYKNYLGKKEDPLKRGYGIFNP